MALLNIKNAVKILFVIFWLHGAQAEVTVDNPIPVIPPNFTQLATKAGLPCEEHEVVTTDHYILTMFHVPGSKKSNPVLVQSGNLGSSDDYITRGNTSLIYVLWKAGYDVWVMNVRGCRYGRRHKSLNPDLDDEFWKFSIHEFAIYDLADSIDYVLKQTRAKTLTSIGWSCGTQVNYILGSVKPEYADKVNVVISLAPIAYLHHSKPFNTLGPFAPLLNITLEALDSQEVLGENSTVHAQLRELCATDPTTSLYVCMALGFFPVVGTDFSQIEQSFSPIFFAHYPSSTSRQNEIHLSQILNTKRFAPYDYGVDDNKIRYGCELPPEYDLSKNNMKVLLISGKNDMASALGDVDLLKTKLPNIIDHIILEEQEFNHLDFVCGRDTHSRLYEPIIVPAIEKNKR